MIVRWASCFKVLTEQWNASVETRHVVYNDVADSHNHTPSVHGRWGQTGRRSCLSPSSESGLLFVNAVERSEIPLCNLEGPGFKSLPGDRLYWRILRFSCSCTQILEQFLKLGHSRLLSHPFQLFADISDSHGDEVYFVLGYDAV
jgi:hypothetical protein